jgi:hypothetical protein
MQLDQKSRYLAQHNVDSGAFHTDTMHEACQPHQTPSMGLHSSNVKRSHNGRKAAKAALGVTGGFVAESDVITIRGKGCGSKSSQKHALRRMRKGTQRRIG